MDFPMNQLLAKTYLENQKKRKEQEKISRQKQKLLNEFTNPLLTGTGNTYILKQQDYNQIFGKGYSTLFNENTPKYQLRKLFQTKRQQEQMQELLDKSSLKTLKALKNSIIEFNDFVSSTFAEKFARVLGYNQNDIYILKDYLEQKYKVNPGKLLLQFLFQSIQDEYHNTQFQLIFQKMFLALAKKYRPTFINHLLSDDMVRLNSTKSSIKLNIDMIFLNPLMEEIESYIKMPKENLPTNFYTRLSNEILNTINKEKSTLQLYEDTEIKEEGVVQSQRAEGRKRRNAIDMGIKTGKNPFNIPKKVTFDDEISQMTKQIQKKGIFSQQDLQFIPQLPQIRSQQFI